jgi:hypothetical protein
MFPLGPFGPFARLCKVHYLRIADLGADSSERRLSTLNVEMCMTQHRSVWVEAHAYFSIRGGGSTGVLRSASTQTRRETHNLWNPDHSDPNKKRVLKPKASSPKFIWCEERC